MNKVLMQGLFGQMGSEMRLYDQRNRRLYINASERERFLAVAQNAELATKALCYTLNYTGCRLSEALALTCAAVEPQAQQLPFFTLKKRNKPEVREIPIPPVLAEVLTALSAQRAQEYPDLSRFTRPLWTCDGNPANRVTGYRWVKAVMNQADIAGPQASPKGLRHGYGVLGIQSGVQLNMLRKWMGHASITTTAIYANAMGAEELVIAGRMWG